MKKGRTIVAILIALVIFAQPALLLYVRAREKVRRGNAKLSTGALKFPSQEVISMTNNNVIQMTRKKRNQDELGYRRFIEHLAFPVSLLIAVVVPALLLTIPTAGLFPFALLMANDLFGVAIGAFMFMRLSRTGLTVLSLEPVVPNMSRWRLKKAA